MSGQYSYRVEADACAHAFPTLVRKPHGSRLVSAVHKRPMPHLLVVSLAALLMLLSFGCGADEGERTPNGTYALERPDGCLVTYVFERDVSEYALIEACRFRGGGVGAEGEGGSYYVDENAGTITFNPDESTCDTREMNSYTLDYDLYENGDLFLAGESAVARFAQVPDEDSDDPASGGVVELGCWDGDSFTPNTEL